MEGRNGVRWKGEQGRKVRLGQPGQPHQRGGGQERSGEEGEKKLSIRYHFSGGPGGQAHKLTCGMRWRWK